MRFAQFLTVPEVESVHAASLEILEDVGLLVHSQMAQFYNVPSGGYIGLTNAHLNDAQSGYETGMNTMGALLAGADMFNMGGLLGGLMAFDYAKAVIDNEIALMLKQANRGVVCSPAELALDQIRAAGPGGSHMESLHTVERMRTTALFPEVATRDMRDTWMAAGSPDAQQRALERARNIMCTDNPDVFSVATDQKIRSRFPGLVAGNAVWKT